MNDEIARERAHALATADRDGSAVRAAVEAAAAAGHIGRLQRRAALGEIRQGRTGPTWIFLVRRGLA